MACDFFAASALPQNSSIPRVLLDPNPICDSIFPFDDLLKVLVLLPHLLCLHFQKKKKVFKWLHPIMKLKERIKVKPLAYFLLAKIFLLVKKTLFLPFSFFLNYWKFVFWPLICVIQDKGWDSTKSLIVRYKKCLKYIYDVFSWTFCFKRKFYCVVHLSGADIPFFPLYKQRIQCIFYILNNKIYVIK